LEVHWPSGKTEHFSVATINSFVTLREGGGVPDVPAGK
jgi:hypothetical protein